MVGGGIKERVDDRNVRIENQELLMLTILTPLPHPISLQLFTGQRLLRQLLVQLYYLFTQCGLHLTRDYTVSNIDLVGGGQYYNSIRLQKLSVSGLKTATTCNTTRVDNLIVQDTSS